MSARSSNSLDSGYGNKAERQATQDHRPDRDSAAGRIRAQTQHAVGGHGGLERIDKAPPFIEAHRNRDTPR